GSRFPLPKRRILYLTTNTTTSTEWQVTPLPDIQYVNTISPHPIAKKETKMANVKIPKIVIYPYNNYSKGARQLCEAFGYTRIKREILFSDFESNPESWKERTVINWGSTQLPFTNSRIINHPSKVQV